MTPEELGLLEQVSELPEKERTVLHLHYWGGLRPAGDRRAAGRDGPHGENAAQAGPGRPAETMGGSEMKLYHSAMEHWSPPAGGEGTGGGGVGGPQTHQTRLCPPGCLATGGWGGACWPPTVPGPGGRRCCWAGTRCSPGGSARRPPRPPWPALQDVFVSSVCDDVTLTVRQALVSDKTIYLVLDYQLPDTVDRAWLQQIFEGENPGCPPSVVLFCHRRG